MKYYLLVIALIFSTYESLSQSVNDYKYVIVPQKFDFLISEDQYQLNSLTKFLFNKYGFDAYLNKIDAFPMDYSRKECNALYANVTRSSTLLRTRVQVELLDCDDNVIFVSEEGDSKEKEYKRAYYEALREAFISIKDLNYTYDGERSVPNSDPQAEAVRQESILIQNNENILEKAEKTYFISTDGSFQAVKINNTVLFYEGTEIIGTSKIDEDASNFKVMTSEFSGSGYFLNSELIVERIIKGIANPIKMVFVRK